MDKRIAIIGGGIGGMAAGCFAQMNGYSSEIFEMHSVPGGVCTAWKRQGYTFDGCIHHLPGFIPGSKYYNLWVDLGIMPGLDPLYADELVQVESAGGRKLTVYTDLDMLADHLVLEFPGPDSTLLTSWVMAMRSFAGSDITEMALDSGWEKAMMLKRVPDLLKWGKYTLAGFAERRLTDPFLRKAFPSILYNTPSNPLILQMNLLAACSTREYGWPAGGSLAFARAMERRYKELGGELHYRARVEKVLVENDRAAGVRLEDGTEHKCDIVISNAYGKTAIFDMLDGKYAGKSLRRYYSRPVDDIGMGIHLSLGVDRDLAGEPHALVLLLDEPMKIADRVRDRLAVDIYSFDPSMAPPGKSVVKVVLPTSYSYWKDLCNDRERYDSEKQRLAVDVVEVLDARFPGLKQQVEVLDVATPMTTERYTGIATTFKMGGGLLLRSQVTSNGVSMTLPGLEDFYMVGQWGGLPGIGIVAGMGRQVIEKVKAKDVR